MAHILDLPEEIILIIFGHLIKIRNQKEFLVVIPKVCRRWKMLCFSRQLWNKYDGSLPSEFLLKFCEKGILRNTEELVYSKTLFLEKSEKLQTIFAGLPNLKTIDFCQVNQFTPDVLIYLKNNCKNVCELKISNWFFEADATFFFGFLAFGGYKLTKLELTKLSISNFSTLVFAIINVCCNLEELELGNFCTSFVFPLPEAQKCCTQLKVLSFCSLVIFPSNCPKLPGFPLLEVFKYPYDLILGSDSRLSHLKFYDNNLTSILSQSPLLKVLDISGHESISANAVVSLPAAELQSLCISRTVILDLQICAHMILTKWERSLRKLDISYTNLECINEVLQYITSDGKMSSLSYLDLSCTNVTNETILRLIENCWKLNFLKLYSCHYAGTRDKKTFNCRYDLLKLYGILSNNY